VRTDAVRLGDIAKPVFIYDRGAKDGAAYVDEDIFNAALSKVGLNPVEARDVYDGVIFLDTAAIGALEHYTHANNEARRESPEEAVAINNRTHQAWVGTPHLITVSNRENETFGTKIHECLEALARILGVPAPLEKEKKFLLPDFSLNMLPNGAVPIDIIQTYLVSNNPKHVERVRARGQHDRYLYFHTIKEFYAPGEAVERDRLITQRVFSDLQVRRDHSLLSINKTRHCFSAHGHYYELDVFHGHREGLVLLEVEVENMESEVFIPPELGTAVEVTEDPQYGNKHLAQAT
jgi:CYTH domain-containing protein